MPLSLLVLSKSFKGALTGALFFSSISAQAYLSDKNNFGMYEEYLMSSAGVAYLGSAGNVTLNPAGLGFITETERYHTVLLVASMHTGDEATIDNGLSFIPSFVAKNFAFLDGVIQPYFSSFDLSTSITSVEGASTNESTGETKSYRAGLGWGRKWNTIAFGLSAYFESASNTSTNFGENQTPGQTSVFNLKSNSQTYTLGTSLGLAQKLDGWTWGIKFSPPPILLYSREKITGTFHDTTNNTQTSLDSTGSNSVVRVPFAIAGFTFDLKQDLHLLTDVGYVFGAKGNDDIGKVNYSGAPVYKLGLKMDLENNRNIYFGSTIDAQNTDRKSGENELTNYGFSGGFKHRIKTSHALYGVSYNQNESGGSRSYMLIFGSDFSL